MTDKLSANELVALVGRVFSPGTQDHRLAVMVDLPDAEAPDTPLWRARREMAANWVELLAPRAGEVGLDAVELLCYRNPRANNADLPATCVPLRGGALPETADELPLGAVPFDRIFETFQILIAPTQFSATAPLKMAAKVHGFRAATMPGFSAQMIPALRLDYALIGARVEQMKKMLDQATGCEILFQCQGKEHRLALDLRHRTAHASGGVFPSGGVAGNLPSGESYIVPYEGELDGDPSLTQGEIPVQLGDDVVVYRVERNRAVEVLSDNPASRLEAEQLAQEPAYGNIAELGLGVLGDFGLEPTGEILLDEKLGLHIAFGRSEHFGGQVGPAAFSRPDRVVHIDRIYIPSLQPQVLITEAVLVDSAGQRTLLVRDGKYAIDFDK